MKKRLMLALCATALLANGPALADHEVGNVLSAINNKNLMQADALLSEHNDPKDKEIKSILDEVRARMIKDPDYAAQLMTLAGKYADDLTPPGVPPVCDTVRQIVKAVTPEMKKKPFYATVQTVAEQFAKSPVVISAGNPNLCEQAFEEAQSGEDAEFAQLPGLMAPGLPFNTLIQPPFDPPRPTSAE